MMVSRWYGYTRDKVGWEKKAFLPWRDEKKCCSDGKREKFRSWFPFPAWWSSRWKIYTLSAMLATIPLIVTNYIHLLVWHPFVEEVLYPILLVAAWFLIGELRMIHKTTPYIFASYRVCVAPTLLLQEKKYQVVMKSTCMISHTIIPVYIGNNGGAWIGLTWR